MAELCCWDILGKKWITAAHCFARAQRIISRLPPNSIPIVITMLPPIHSFMGVLASHGLRYQSKQSDENWMTPRIPGIPHENDQRTLGRRMVLNILSGSTHTDHLVALEGSLGRQPSSAIPTPHCLLRYSRMQTFREIQIFLNDEFQTVSFSQSFEI